MTEFEMRIETDYSGCSSNHECGTAELELFFDEKSAKAFFQWMADGRKGSLTISEKGCEYCPIPLTINANPTEEDIERIKKMVEDAPSLVVPSWNNTITTTGAHPPGNYITCQLPGTAVQMTAYQTEDTGTYHFEKVDDSETRVEK